jgi:hypothetical protein
MLQKGQTPLLVKQKSPLVNAKNIKLKHGQESHWGSKPSITVLDGNPAANFCSDV